MKRMQLFEFEDFRWFPSSLRDCLTLYIPVMHKLLGTERELTPLLARALQHSGTNSIIDLCSGAGGPLPWALERLEKEHGLRPQATMTDLYPNADRAAHFNQGPRSSQLRYQLEPVDAGKVPEGMQGVRTMLCSFHHMPPPVARSILEDAFAKRQPLCVFEMSDNSQPRWLWWTAFPIGLLMVLALTPLVRPLRLRQLLFTYLVPVLPLAIAWDGAVSNARTYTQEDLRELLTGLDAPDYSWEVGVRKTRGAGMVYLLGLPRREPGSASA